MNPYRLRRAMLLVSGALLAGSLAAGCGAAPAADERGASRVGEPDMRAGPSGSSPDAADRDAFRAWFVLLADAQFYRPTSDVTDCAGLVRHAAREALRPHTPEWLRRMRLPITRVYPDVENRPVARDGMLPIFRVSDGRDVRYVEFADAHTIVRDNAVPIGRDVAALRAADLLVFFQPHQDEPYHVMVFVGPSVFEDEGRDWLVYHTGPVAGAEEIEPAERAGEVRKVRLADLLRHPEPRWRPLAVNPRFLGVYRLRLP